MKVSYNWLQTFFEEKLPSAEEVSEALTFHSFEVEDLKKVEEFEEDFILDIDILPNRAHDCMGHLGIAREISAIFNIPLKKDIIREKQEDFKDLLKKNSSKGVSLVVDEPELCSRYSIAVVKGVKTEESPKWLKRKLESVGQKSINNIVDITNFVMLELGQPMHAFDMDKLEEKEGVRKIQVRKANKGEKVTTLENEDCKMEGDELLIADGFSSQALGVAGVKGGKYAEINNDTKNIILESAFFEPISIRKTSRKIGIQTDASKRFEHEIEPKHTDRALMYATSLIVDNAGGEVEGYDDFYENEKEDYFLNLSEKEVSSLLGVEIDMGEIRSIFERLGFEIVKEEKLENEKEEGISLKIPPERIDIKIKEDLIEEVARIYGYKNIEDKEPEKNKEDVIINKNYYFSEILKDFLAEEGFSEVYTYVFRNDGEVECANPVASDKAFLRSNLLGGILESLEFNFRNADLLALDTIKIFEIGKVFRKDKEYNSLSLGVMNARKNKKDKSAKEKIEDVVLKIEENFGTFLDGKIEVVENENGERAVLEINLEEIIEKIDTLKNYSDVKKLNFDKKYKQISQFPYALRDIAVWVPEDVSKEYLLKVILSEAGEIVVNNKLFDEYHKDKFISYAYRLVFQSYEKTLSDKEVNEVMDKIYKKIGEKGWEVR